MAFLGNRAINRLNIHSAIQALAQNAGGVFVFVYMLKAGVPVALVFCAMAGMNACRFVLRPLVLPLTRRIGLRRLLMLGTVSEALIYPMLPGVHGVGPMLGAVVGVGSIGSVLYWTSYHAYFSSLGDAADRGGQVGVRESLTGAVSIFAPLLGAWTILTAGPGIAFLIVAGVQASAALPLLGAPEVTLDHEPPAARRTYLQGALIQATDGWVAAGYFYVWQIALFIGLGERFAAYGGAMAAAAALGAVGSLVVGRLIDRGDGRRWVVLAYGMGIGATVLMAFSLRSPALAIAANALAAFAARFLSLTMMARVYNLSKASPCPLRFHIATEGGWDTGCALGCLAAAGLSAVGAGLAPGILLAVLGLGAGASMLFVSYGRNLGADERTRTSTPHGART